MGLFSRLFGSQQSRVNALDCLDAETGKHVVNREVQTQCRRAQDLPVSFTDAVRDLCNSEDRLSSCFLLDVREPATEQIKLFIDVQIDGVEDDVEQIMASFQNTLAEFPDIAGRAFISLQAFDLPTEDAFYQRVTK